MEPYVLVKGEETLCLANKTTTFLSRDCLHRAQICHDFNLGTPRKQDLLRYHKRHDHALQSILVSCVFSRITGKLFTIKNWMFFILNHLSNFLTITLTLHGVLKFLKFWFYVARDSPPLTVLMHARHWSNVICFHTFHWLVFYWIFRS